MDPAEFDRWREAYDRMTYADHVAFYDRVARDHPHQVHYPLAAVRDFFDGQGGTVVEIGGWRGELAADILPGNPDLLSWTNVEICRWAVCAPACSDPRYGAFVPDRWVWEMGPITADHLVASHVVEHLSDAHARLLVRALDVERAIVAAPMDDGPVSWRGYFGSHALTMGWDGLDALFADAGHAVARRERHLRVYERVNV